MDEKKAQNLSGIPNYSVKKILEIFNIIMQSKIDLLIAPIWFFTYNDIDIEEIIQLSKHLENQGHKSSTPMLGIQNYLLYKTGRKFWKVEPRSFDYFYAKLSELEKKYKMKLKLGPLDFGIHPTNPITPPVNIGSKVPVTVLCKGRSNIEFIGPLNEIWAVKILSKIPLPINKKITVKIIKQKMKENLITGKFEGSF